MLSCLSKICFSFLTHQVFSVHRITIIFIIISTDNIFMFQILASVLANGIVIQAGINMSFSAILLPQLAEGGDMQISKSEGSWIGTYAILPKFLLRIAVFDKDLK